MKLRFSQQNYDTTKEIAMRKIILGTVFGLVFSIGAYTSAKAGNGYCEPSDPCGGWVKIDASGLAISGAMVCTPSVCGDPNSLFSRLTLNAGEQYVQQTVADPVTGNVVGIGNNNPGTTVTYDRPSETFTIVNEPQPTAAAQQPTSEPSSPPATGVEPTSGPQPAREATSQSAPEATPAPPVVGQPTPTSIPPVVVEPTQTPEPVVPRIVPTVDPNVIPNTYEWKLSDNNGEFRWQPKRRSYFSGEQQAI